jgi:hypothetical protein
MRAAVLVAVLVATTASAFAQAPGQTPISDPDEPSAPVPRAPAEPARSEVTATSLAIGVTVGGFATMLVGATTRSEPLALAGAAATLVGPSAGHIYAGAYGHALGMSLVRAAGVVVFAIGVSEMTVVEADGGPWPSGGSQRGNGAPLMVAGAATVLAATAYDIYDAHRAARRRNAEVGLAVAPTLMAHGGGVALAGSF